MSWSVFWGCVAFTAGAFLFKTLRAKSMLEDRMRCVEAEASNLRRQAIEHHEDYEAMKKRLDKIRSLAE